ncbi:MAG: hypothetical protein NZ934_02985 [Hadesarchaea archaeon]|nr:hypothetical protein [Hadesarchaea archaeon]
MADFSFDDLKRTWKEEWISQELTDLPSDFYSKVSQYVAELDRELRRSELFRQELLRGELHNVIKMVQEIYLLRLLKAIEEITKGRLPNSLVERERQAFTEIKRILDELHAELVVPAITGRAKITPRHEITNVLLVFSSEIPQIIGDDLKPYGPFRKGEAAFLPKRTAELILKHGLARRVEVGGP